MTLPRLKVKPNPKPKESGKQAPKMLKPRKRKRSRLKTSLLKSKVNLLLDANANDPRLQVKKSRKRFLLLLLSPRRVKALRASRSPNLRLRLRKPRKKSGLRLSLNRSQTIRGADNDVTPTNLMKVGRKSLSLDLMSRSQMKLKNFPRKAQEPAEKKKEVAKVEVSPVHERDEEQKHPSTRGGRRQTRGRGGQRPDFYEGHFDFN